MLDHSRLILGIAAVVTLAGALLAFMMTPVYETNLLIHVEEDSPRESKNLLGELNALFDQKTSAAAEMELLRSRLVVSRAIDNHRL